MKLGNTLRTMGTDKKVLFIISRVLLLFFSCTLIYLAVYDRSWTFYDILPIMLAVLCLANGALVTYILLVSRARRDYGAPDISKIILLSESNSFKKEYPLDDRKSALIGKGEHSYIDLENTGYPHLIGYEHAVLNRVQNVWYVERVSDEGRVGLRRAGSQFVYKLKTGNYYKLSAYDTLYVANEKLLVL